MSIKENLRVLTQKSNTFEKIWLILQWQKTKYNALRYSDYEYARKLWKARKGYDTDFSNPQTFDEKMWFLKLSNRDPLLTQCSDKHAVREYVKACGYENILKEEYACFDSADDIDFEKLPSPCYLKCNHASGMNYIYRKDKPFDKKHLRWKFNYQLKQNPYYLSREWNYKNIPPKIVCEEVLEMPDGSDIPELQFFCFYGEPKFVIYNLGLADKSGRHKDSERWFLWNNWSLIRTKSSKGYNYQERKKSIPPKPSNYHQLIECAKVLSKPFPLVRVDLFNIENKIYFNELTFYSGGGFTLSKTPSVQNLGGKYLDVSQYHIADDALQKHTKQEI